MSTPALDRSMLDMAGRAGLRAAGNAEPNPLVGCVIGTPAGVVLGIGHHRRFGGPHAEIEALADCRRRGSDPRGATAWVTLEPCDHTGKTGPCSRALIDAGVARVVIAREDPNPLAAGGAGRLRAAGVQVTHCGASRLASGLAAPFVKRMTTGLPWVIAKWAQTLDGKVATRAGDSKWISCAASRRRVHRWRAGVDVVLTGIGTVLADDPLLTARGVRLRRRAVRVLVDSRLRIPEEGALMRSAREVPLVIAGLRPLVEAGAGGKVERLRRAGATVIGMDAGEGGIDLRGLLETLARDHGTANVLVEAGPRLLGGLFDAGLVDEARVFIAPVVLGDGSGMAPVGGRGRELLAQAAQRLSLVRGGRIGLTDDALLVYRRAERPGG